MAGKQWPCRSESIFLDTVNSGRYTAKAPAKSGVGIATPELTERTTALKRFFCAKHSHTSQWWGVQGGRKARRVTLLTGCCNPVRLTTHEIATSRGELSHTQQRLSS